METEIIISLDVKVGENRMTGSRMVFADYEKAKKYMDSIARVAELMSKELTPVP